MVCFMAQSVQIQSAQARQSLFDRLSSFFSSSHNDEALQQKVSKLLENATQEENIKKLIAEHYEIFKTIIRKSGSKKIKRDLFETIKYQLVSILTSKNADQATIDITQDLVDHLKNKLEKNIKAQTTWASRARHTRNLLIGAIAVGIMIGTAKHLLSSQEKTLSTTTRTDSGDTRYQFILEEISLKSGKTQHNATIRGPFGTRTLKNISNEYVENLKKPMPEGQIAKLVDSMYKQMPYYLPGESLFIQQDEVVTKDNIHL